MNNHSDKINSTLLCTGACIAWYALTLVVSALPNYRTLSDSGMLMPVLCMVEFIALVPLYRWYTKHHHDIPLGELKGRQTLIFSLLLIGLIVSQTFYLRQESWTGSQIGREQTEMLLFILSVVLLAPVFEEIVFRGFMLQVFLIWAPRQRLACALLTSVTFAAMHTQYTHLQTMIALFILSLLLCYARLVSNGLKLPVFLHMLNNFIGISPWLWLALTR